MYVGEDFLRNGLVNEVIKTLATNSLQHDLKILLVRTNMSVDELKINYIAKTNLEGGREGTGRAEKASTESHSRRSTEGLSKKALHSILSE